MDRCWILLGMMGAGKSSIGRALAELSGREFLDTDLLMQTRLGRPIPQIFQIYGESTFRDHETSILRSLEPHAAVLATGGGIVLREENWKELRRLGITIFLDASVETITDRLARSKKKRPLLQVEDWPERVESLLEQRRELYRRADITVAVDDVDLELGAQRVYDALLGATA
ncbi:shikimate kinase [Fimbriimonas ginsengisoli]|uniref:Shikimate kinase n=1 Tax=Fimbriimonas ginsengisoli Gsoil 348 TaxID=661478 RepID=A0A068NQR0_FIMGI|nr:shikimate kinase [Fimbriimonas ginsengisoli]AIE85781.1 shikimate kinase [Fimbriimonas ginsengisoli Gsoil 348]